MNEASGAETSKPEAVARWADRRFMARVSVALAVVAAVVGWLSLGSLGLGANDVLGDTGRILTTIEGSLAGSIDTAAATADALDGAAASLDQAAETSDATSTVAADMSDVAGTLPPVLEGVSVSLNRIDDSIASINELLDSVPLVTARVDRIDARILDTEPLVADLEDARVSLSELSTEAAAFGPRSRELSDDLSTVADELRASTGDLEQLRAQVAETRDQLPAELGGGGRAGLLVARLVIVALALAVVAGQLPNLIEPTPAGKTDVG